LYHPATKPLGHSRRWSTLTGALQRALRGQRFEGVFPADRHTQARRHAFHSYTLFLPLPMPLAQVHEQREIPDGKQRQQ
jgi:hypothetical protein